MTIGVVVGAAAIVGGGGYYQNWVLNKWPIPSDSTVRHLPRLMAIVTNERDYRGPNANSLYQRNQKANDAIVSLGSKAVPFLLKQVKSPAKPEQQRRLVRVFRCLHAIASTNGLGPHTDAVVEKVTSDPRLFGSAARLLGAIGEEALPIIIDSLDAKDPRIISAAAWSLGEMPPGIATQALPELQRACLARDWSRRSHLVRFSTLVKVAEKDALPTLLQVVEDRSAPMRMRALAGSFIGSLGADGIVALDSMIVLINELDDDDSTSMVIRAIGSIGPFAAERTTPVLLNFLNKEERFPYSREGAGALLPPWAEAVNALAAIESPSAVPALIELLDDDRLDLPSKQHVVNALGTFGPAAAAATPSLKEISQIDPKRVDEAELRSVAMVAMSRISRSSPGVVRSILKRLQQVLDEVTTEYGAEPQHFAYGVYGGYNRELTEPDRRRHLIVGLLMSLTWVGGREDPLIMNSRAANSGAVMHAAILPSSRQIKAINARFQGMMSSLTHGSWSRGGCVLALHKALAEGLKSSDASVQFTSIDVMMAIDGMPPSTIKALQQHLTSDNQQLRMRAAAALIAFGVRKGAPDSDPALAALREAVAAAKDVPPHVRAVHDAKVKVTSPRTW